MPTKPISIKITFKIHKHIHTYWPPHPAKLKLNKINGRRLFQFMIYEYQSNSPVDYSLHFGRTECRIGPEISNRTKKCRIGHRIWGLYSLIMLTIFTVKTHLTHKLLLHQSKQNSK